MTAFDRQKANAALLCADEIDRACDEMVASEGLALAALCVALGRRIARSVGREDAVSVALMMAFHSVALCAAKEFASGIAETTAPEEQS